MTERIVFLDRGTVKVPLRKPAFPHTWIDHPSTHPNETLARLKDVTIAITNKVKIGESEIAANPTLRMIALSATGVDNVDLEACRKRSIVVSNVPHYTSDSLPEQVFMYLLALRRNLLRYHEAVQQGAWSRSVLPAITDFPILDLRGSTLGIIGVGDLGKRVAQLGEAFGMKVLLGDHRGKTPRAGRVAFEQVLAESDAITLHCPLTPETRQLINAETLALMKPSAILINTARGALVDEAALAAALASNRLAGAAVDVLSTEPPPDSNPLLRLRLPNLIVTPHNAWASDHSLSVLAEKLIQNLEAFVAGSPANRVA